MTEPNEYRAGQLLYEADCARNGEEPNWKGVPAASKWRWLEKAEFNASVTPKAQTIKAP